MPSPSVVRSPSAVVLAVALAGALSGIGALGGCDSEAVDAGGEAGVADAGADGGRDAVVDGGRDAGSDGGRDAAVDAMAADAAVDAAADAAVDPLTVPCAAVASRRAGLRVDGCRFVRAGEAAVVPVSVVVSADSFARVAATPFHEPAHYAELAAAGVEVVWLLVQWHAIEPGAGTYNGAYMGRICQQARLAAAAGLDVVLSMEQARFGPGFGGRGMPEWVGAGAPIAAGAAPGDAALGAAWAGFWADPAHAAALGAAWARLLDTCAVEAAHGIDGIHVIGGAIGDAMDGTAYDALIDRVMGDATARLGPVLRFEEALWTPDGLHWPGGEGPDRVRTLPGWGPGRDVDAALADAGWITAARDAAWRAGRPLWIRALGGVDPAAMGAALAAAEGAGVPVSVWQDGFGGAFGLRDAEGRPGALWAPALVRPRPVSVAGRMIGWHTGPDAITLRWWADGRAQGLSRFALAGRPARSGRLSPDGPFDWFVDHDPATDQLAVFVEGAAGVVELTLPMEAR